MQGLHPCDRRMLQELADKWSLAAEEAVTAALSQSKECTNAGSILLSLAQLQQKPDSVAHVVKLLAPRNAWAAATFQHFVGQQ